MNKRYLTAFVLTALLYGVSFMGYSYAMSNMDTLKSSSQQIAKQDCIIKVALYTPPAVTPTKKEEPKKNKEINCEDCKLVEKKPLLNKPIKKEPKKEVIVKKEAIKKIEKPKEPVKKVVHKPKKIQKQTPKKEIVKHTPTPKQQTAQVLQRATTTKVAKKETPNLVQQKLDNQKELEAKNRYLANVKKIIENNKFYPNSAKRRGLESNIPIKFLISKDGTISNIEILGGKKIFHKSVKQTLENSFPIDPKGVLKESIEVSLVLKYNLI